MSSTTAKTWLSELQEEEKYTVKTCEYGGWPDFSIQNLFSLKFETGSYFLKSMNWKFCTLGQTRLVRIQNRLWRYRCLITSILILMCSSKKYLYPPPPPLRRHFCFRPSTPLCLSYNLPSPLPLNSQLGRIPSEKNIRVKQLLQNIFYGPWQGGGGGGYGCFPELHNTNHVI